MVVDRIDLRATTEVANETHLPPLLRGVDGRAGHALLLHPERSVVPILLDLHLDRREVRLRLPAPQPPLHHHPRVRLHLKVAFVTQSSIITINTLMGPTLIQ